MLGERLLEFASHAREVWSSMELRHLRFFVAVAEEGSVTLAAEKRLHTAQPSLSRQLRALEQEVGVELFMRGARGVELTAAGRAFLDHARLALARRMRRCRRRAGLGRQGGRCSRWGS